MDIMSLMNILRYEIKRLGRKFKRAVSAWLPIRHTLPHYYEKWRILSDFFVHKTVLIESGTYLGETTQVLSRSFMEVITFEPFEPLADYNKWRFSHSRNIKVYNTTSQALIANVLSKTNGTVNFWLDGHYSGNGTYGNLPTASPILQELSAIFDWASQTNRAYIAIDDARLFNAENGYPSEIQMTELVPLCTYQIKRVNDMFLISPKTS